MIRVAAVMDTITVSGPARQLVASFAPLRERGVAMHVLGMHPAGRSDTPFLRLLQDTGIPHTPVAAYGRFRWATIRALDEALTTCTPTIVQTHSYRPNAHLLALRLLGRVHAPWIAFFHGITAENWRVRAYHALDRLVLPRADAVFVVADTQRQQVGSSRNVEVIANAILPLSSEETSSESAAPAAGAPIVLFIGRLSHEKGVDLLLAAWPAVQAQVPHANLSIVGDGPARAQLESIVAGAGLQDRVTFHGHQAEPWPFYRHASVVVLPSRSEGMPNVLLEAIARDVPVVASRTGGIPALLGDPPAGSLVEVGDTDGLAAALVASLRGESEERLAERRAAARERLSLASRATRLAELYACFASGRGR